MKSICQLIILFLLVSAPAYSQQFIVANEENNFVWVGMYNHLSAAAYGCPCESLILSTTNGKIVKQGCRFYYMPDSVGPVTIVVRQRLKNKTRKIGEAWFRAKPLPDPIVYLGGLQKGSFTKKFLANQGGIRAQIPPPPDICTESGFIRVDSFTTEITRNQTVIFSRRCSHGRFDEQVTNAILTTQAGDTVSFINVSCKLANGSYRLAKPAEFSIID